jgi:hypothetical protein
MYSALIVGSRVGLYDDNAAIFLAVDTFQLFLIQTQSLVDPSLVLQLKLKKKYQ